MVIGWYFLPSQEIICLCVDSFTAVSIGDPDDDFAEMAA